MSDFLDKTTPEDEEYVWAQWAGTTFLIDRAKELEQVAVDQGRSGEVRLVAAEYAVAIRRELRP